MERSFEKLSFSFVIILLLAFNVHAGGGIVGKVTILKGQVYIKRGSAKIPVKKDDTVLESDIIESEAGTARITMIDSNLVDVYPRSRLEIAKYVYKPNQDQKDVELKVDFGKIKSTVNQKYDGAKNKFQVKTPSAVAGVRGTVFTAEYDAVKKISRVVTIEGLVAVTKMLDRGERQSPPVFVRPDQVVKVDVEQSKAEQPRDLQPEEKETRQKEDKDLGYQYDPKKDSAASTAGERPAVAINEPKRENKEPGKEQVKEPNKEPAKEQAREQVKDIKERLKERLKEAKNDMASKEPVKIKDNVTAVSNNVGERQQQQQQQDQERRQKESEEEQAKKQKQLEDEQTKKQKQLEEEQGRKQKQLEEEQAKKQKQLEDEQTKKQKQLEEEQARKQKQLEEEQQRKQRELEEVQKKAEAAKRAQELANRLKNPVGLPSGTSPNTTPGTTTNPK